MIEMANEILFRASATGKLMTNSRTKSETLSATTKTYLNEVFVEKVYGIKKDIKSKYISKGLMVEEDSLKLYSKFKDKFYLKNEEWFANEYISGTPDVAEDDLIIDVKSSWDAHTFQASKTGKLNKLYYWQLQSYMWLTETTKAKLVYCLIDTPETLIEDEKRKLMWNMGLIDENDLSRKAFAEIEQASIFSQIPIEQRIHEIDIERNDEDIELLKTRVLESRIWMNTELFNLEIA